MPPPAPAERSPRRSEAQFLLEAPPVILVFPPMGIGPTPLSFVSTPAALQPICSRHYPPDFSPGFFTSSPGTPHSVLYITQTHTLNIASRNLNAARNTPLSRVSWIGLIMRAGSPARLCNFLALTAPPPFLCIPPPTSCRFAKNWLHSPRFAPVYKQLRPSTILHCGSVSRIALLPAPAERLPRRCEALPSLEPPPLATFDLRFDCLGLSPIVLLMLT